MHVWLRKGKFLKKERKKKEKEKIEWKIPFSGKSRRRKEQVPSIRQTRNRTVRSQCILRGRGETKRQEDRG